MDIREYIRSGIIEAYVLGLATEQEVAEIEKITRDYPVLKEAVVDFEISLEQAAFSNAVAPPVQVKSLVENELSDEFSAAERTIISKEPVSEKRAEVRHIQPRTNSFWKYMAAA